MTNEPWKHAYIEANGIKIHYVTAGSGDLLVLLHGFPEFWYAWRHQIPFLAKHFQVIVPDLRGYGETEKPPNVSDYTPLTLAQDIVSLIQALGHEKADIVGHDWGGAVAWRMALNFPNSVNRLVILNSPHPLIFSRALKSNFQQIKKSWYIFFFQIPYLPEWIFKLNPKKFINDAFRGMTIRKDTFTDEDLEQYQESIEKPGAYTAALNYYRAAFSQPSKESLYKKIKAPTLLIWGENDTALGKELTYNMEDLFEGPFNIEYIANCSHWVNEEKPDEVNQLLLKFLT